MRTYRSGEPASYGVYWSASPIELRFVGSDGELLEGTRGARYHRLPMLVAFAMSPVLGGVFVLFFPMIVLGAVASVGGMVLARKLAALAEGHAHLLQARLEPLASYLHRPAEGKEEGAGEDEALRSLEEEVRERREAEGN